MAFQDYWSELVGTIPALSYLNAQNIVNQAFRELRSKRLWSWCVVNNAYLYAPVVITEGTIAANFGSVTAQAGVAAMAVLNPATTAGNPPMASGGSLGIGRQIRIGANANPQGPVYDIVNYNTGTGVITLDRPYGEPSVTAANYMVYKCYYAAPFTGSGPTSTSATFGRFISITNVGTGYTIRGKNLAMSDTSINAIDPQRGATGDPYKVAYFGSNIAGQPVYEFYPHPVVQRTYVCMIQVNWLDLSDTVDLPVVSYELKDLLMAIARRKAGEWALANVGVNPSQLAGTNWVAYINQQMMQVRENLKSCLVADDELMPSLPMQTGGTADFPLGGEFLQNHDLSGVLGR